MSFPSRKGIAHLVAGVIIAVIVILVILIILVVV